MPILLACSGTVSVSGALENLSPRFACSACQNNRNNPATRYRALIRRFQEVNNIDPKHFFG